MVYPENKAADEHFDNLRSQFAEALARTRGLCDEATDSLAFVSQSLSALEARSNACEDALRAGDALALVTNASATARIAHRVAQVAKQEAENSEDKEFSDQVSAAMDALQNSKYPW